MIVPPAQSPGKPVDFLSRRQDALYVKDEPGLSNGPDATKAKGAAWLM
jgi:hypothetical protein